MILNLPVRSGVGSLVFTVDLEGTVYQMEFNYNSRDQRFYMNVRSEELVDILMGVPVVLGALLTDRFQLETLPPGSIYGFNPSEPNIEATLLTFGENYLLQYAESE